MNFKKLIKNYKIPLTLGLLAVVGVSFVVGAVVLATSDSDNMLRRALAATGIVNNAEGNDLPTGWHDFNVNERCDIVGWAVDPDSVDTDVTYKVYSDNNLVGNYKAASVRPDLADLGICSGGSCGINATLNIAGTHNIKITVLDNETGQEVNLPNTNQSISCGTDTALPPDQQTRKDIVITSALSTANGQARISVRNSSASITYNLKLESFAASIDFTGGNLPAFIDSQTLYRTDNDTLSPGESASFNVAIPTCVAWQIDFRSTGTGAVILASDIGGSMNSCGEIPPPTCTDPNPARDIQIIEDVRTFGSTNSSRVKNNSSVCTYNVGLASYEAFLQPTFPLSQYGRLQEFIDTQKLFAQDLKQVAPGQTVTLTVPHSQCTVWQVDLFSGPNAPVPPDFWALRNSGYHLFDWEISGTLNSCPAQDDLNVTCVASPSTVFLGETATFTANATGGTGSYTYSWSGAVTGSTRSVSRSFSSTGFKSATVTVTSGGQTDTATCGVSVIREEIEIPPITGSCQGIPSTVNIGQTVNWSAQASGGTGAYGFNWSGAVTGSGSSRSATYSTAGVKNASVVITSGTQSITRNCSVTVTQDIPPLNVTCQGNPSPAFVNQNVIWSSAPSGGTGSYSYSWSGTDGLSGNTQNVTRAYSTTGTKNATVTVTSGNQTSSATCAINIPVVPPPLGGSCQGVPAQVNIGQNVNWTATGTGGTGNYTYNWSGAVTGSGSSRSATYSTAGVKNASVEITSGTQSITRNCQINVLPPDLPPLTGSCQGMPPAVSTGQVVTWSANASGGTGSYNFSWSGAVTGTGISRTAIYSTPGVKNASVVISSGSQSITRDCAVNVTAAPIELYVSCQGSPIAANIGQNISWTSIASGGTGSYTYSWTGTDGLSGNTQNVTRSYSTRGAKDATITVVSGSQSRTATCEVNISSAPIALDGSCIANPGTVNIGQNITWAANASGGTGSYTYSWSGSDDLSGSSQNVTRAYTSSGTKGATVVISSGSESVTRTCQANVVAPTLGVSCSASGSTYRVGDTITWTSNPSGGTGSYAYSWTGTDGLSSNSQNTSRSYGTTGTKTGTITVTSGGQSAQATCQVTISDNIVTNPALNVSCSANPPSVSIGQNVTWSSNVSGGTGFYNYYWSGTDNLSGNNQSITRSYDTTGTKSGTITVTSGGQTSSAVCNTVVGAANIILTSNPVPNPLSFVYLNQIPYTGLMDDMGKVGKMFMLIAWSALVAFVGLKFWNKKQQFAFASGLNVEESNGTLGKLKGILASIIPGAVESPYVAVVGEVLQNEELTEEKEEVSEEIEEMTEEEVIEVADIEALSTLAMDRKALISRQALGAIYEDHSGDFEEASLDLIKVIGRAALAYPREDGWIVLNSERLSTLR